MKQVLLILILAFAAVFFGACGFGDDVVFYETQTPPPAEEAPAPATPEPAPAPSPEPIVLIETGVLRVGNMDFGFVDIPADWEQFANGETLQFSDPAGTGHITMEFIAMPDTYMDSVYLVVANLRSQMRLYGAHGGRGVVIEPVYLDGFSASRLRGLLPEAGLAKVFYVFEREVGMLQQISVIGPFSEIMGMIYIVEETFTMR